MGDDSTDEDNLSGYSAPSLSGKNILRNQNSINHYVLPISQTWMEQNDTKAYRGNFDTKEEHTFYLNDQVDYLPNNSSRQQNRHKVQDISVEREKEDDDSSVGDFVIENQKSPRSFPSSSSFKEQNNASNGSFTVTGPSSIPTKAVKKVSFAAGTTLPKEDHLALSITKHLYTKELGYTQYHIQLLYRGVEWTVYKRYRDFTAFHQQLLAENTKFQIGLPELPKKRWFEKQRWLNKFDESYSLHRRNALQDYLRILAKTPLVKNKFRCFHEFLEIPFDKIKIQDDEYEEIEEEEEAGLHHPSPQPSVTSHFEGNLAPQNPRCISSYSDFDEIMESDSDNRNKSEANEREGDFEHSSFYANSPPPSSSATQGFSYDVHPGSFHSRIARSSHHQGSPPPNRSQLPFDQRLLYQQPHSHIQTSSMQHQHHHQQTHPYGLYRRGDFRDSFLETPLNQQFDDEGEVIISRP